MLRLEKSISLRTLWGSRRKGSSSGTQLVWAVQESGSSRRTGTTSTYGKKGEVPAGEWSTLRVVANGRLFEVYFNGTKLYEVEDATFAQPGKVGVWTKADSVTQFDDLTVVTK
jgi:hypothetical protein